MRISPFKFTTMVFSQIRLEYRLSVDDDALPQLEEFKHLGFLLMNYGKMEWAIDRWIGAQAAVSHVPVCHGENSQLSVFPDNLHFYFHHWSQALGSDQKNKITETSG